MLHPRKERKKTKRFFFLLFLLVVLLGLLTTYQLVTVVQSYILEKQEKSIVKPYEEQASLLQIQQALAVKDIAIESIHVSTDSGRITAKISDGPIVYFSSSQDARWQAATLQSILAKLTIDRKKARTIDLQYEKPVVQF
jgi:hypothetical protein